MVSYTIEYIIVMYVFFVFWLVVKPVSDAVIQNFVFVYTFMLFDIFFKK